jgi:hypothetical protein
MAGQTTYIDLMDFAFGRPGRIAISIFSFIFAFGGNSRSAIAVERLYNLMDVNCSISSVWD